ncbi:hypothetical protein [Roseospira navarrensis]|uniref:DUF2231 domain-containing protein n=1 Tax=Roseospira navarrensis TaxID=140058 RepID=A0A7X2D529_9PROT|nr:hypothetical protein [Roseospira navarrensis]MQX37252.1 hypothetical protein [Roseospira navarrensis]
MTAVLADLYESGAVADLLVALVLLEALGLAWLHRRLGRRGLPWGILLNLATGAALVMALGAALKGAPWPWIGTWLVAALVGHAGDLALRWRAAGRERAGA